MYAIEYLPEAFEELERLDKSAQKTIKEKINLLAQNPVTLKNNIKTLKGKHTGKYRLRVGNYHIIYRLKNETITITIIRIGHRKEIY